MKRKIINLFNIIFITVIIGFIVFSGYVPAFLSGPLFAERSDVSMDEPKTNLASTMCDSDRPSFVQFRLINSDNLNFSEYVGGVKGVLLKGKVELGYAYTTSNGKYSEIRYTCNPSFLKHNNEFGEYGVYEFVEYDVFLDDVLTLKINLGNRSVERKFAVAMWYQVIDIKEVIYDWEKPNCEFILVDGIVKEVCKIKI